MTTPRTAQRTRPELPRLVEQLRILLWMQMHLTLVGLLILLAWMGYVTNVRNIHLYDEVSDPLMLTMALQVGAAVALAVSAKLLWRRWAWVYVLILVAEAAVVAIMVRALASGLVVGILILVYAAITAWILADLARGEVLRFLFRRDGRGRACTTGSGPASW